MFSDVPPALRPHADHTTAETQQKGAQDTVDIQYTEEPWLGWQGGLRAPQTTLSVSTVFCNPQPREHRIGMDLMHRFLFGEPTHPRQEALSTQLLRRELQRLSWCPNTPPDTTLDTS